MIKLHLHGRWVEVKQPVRPDAREPGAYETVTKGFRSAFAPWRAARDKVHEAVRECVHHTNKTAEKAHEAAMEAKSSTHATIAWTNKLADQAEENRKQFTGGK